MDFIEELSTLSGRASEQLEHLKTEESAKNALVMPFIQILGYNIFDPREVVPEFTADVGVKKGEKVDYAIMKDGSPIILIECKSPKCNLNEAHTSQLYRYYSVTKASIGVLTNGIIYQFYTDIEEENKMDDKPFLVFNLLKINETSANKIKKFRKRTFEEDKISAIASNLKYTNELKKIFKYELNTPSENFVRFFTKQIYSGILTQNRMDKFSDITSQAFKQFINDEINDRLMSAIDKKGDVDSGTPKDEATEEEEIDEELVITEEEREAHFVIKTVLRDSLDTNRVGIRPYKSFTNILLDDKVTQPILRLRLDGKQKQIGIFDDEKNEDKMPIESVLEIADYVENMKRSVKYYDTGEYDKEDKSDDDHTE